MISMTSDDRAEAARGKVQVWDPGTGQVAWVTPQEAAAGMVAYGRQEFGEGTPAFAAVVMRAVGLLAEHGFTPGGQRIGRVHEAGEAGRR